MARVLLYTRFERFWHWSQALLILGLLVTGFEIHGSYRLLGFPLALFLHERLAMALIGLWFLAWFWHLTTGAWKHYIPEPRARVVAMARYYLVDIFLGRPHPFHRDRSHRLNPLQGLAYLSLHVLISPLVWISGLLLLAYGTWHGWNRGGGPLSVIAQVHVLAAFLMLAFLVVHLYLALTTSERTLSGLRAMWSGWEDIGGQTPNSEDTPGMPERRQAGE